MSNIDPAATAAPVPAPAPQTTPQPSAGEQKPDAQTADQGATVDPNETPAADAGAEQAAEERRARRRNPAQERINELTADKRRLERENERLLERALNTAPPAAKPVDAASADLKEPRDTDYPNYEDYLKARDEFLVERTRRVTAKEIEEKQKVEQRKGSEEQMRSKAREAAERFNENAKKLSSQYEDLDDVIADMWAGKIPAIADNDHVAKFIMEEAEPETAPALVHFLDANPKEAKRIAALTSPLAVARELTKLEANLPKPKARTVTNAPAPPKEVGGKGGLASADPEKMSIAEYRKWRNAPKKVG